MKYLNLVFDILKFTIKLFLIKINNFKTPIIIEFKNKSHKRSIILGNGPSLLKDMHEINNHSKDKCDFFAVNFFANTNYFFELKPNYYFLADKLFWSDNLNKNFVNLRSDTLDRLKCVNWGMTILCPESGYGYIKSNFFNNSNISIIEIPEKYIELKTKQMQLFVLRNRFFGLPNINSVSTLIWYSIISNYSEIYLYGLDFSGFKSITVNQETNQVSVPVKHFYKNSDAEKDSSNKYQSKKNKSLSVRLYQNYRFMKYNEILNELAVSLRIDIINRSYFSYVDSFKREK